MSKPTADMPTAEQAMERLMAGNKRYVASKQTHPHQTRERCVELSAGQYPFAVILGCADSRVPPEVIFDQGLGDLFVIRVAGNVLDDIVVGSVEYAAAHLHTPLIVVLGHAKCGAVGATVAGGELEGHLPSLAEAIQPAVDQVRDLPGDLVDNAVRANAKMVAEQLRSSQPVLAELANAGELKIVAARYDLDTGLVELLQA
jgi:carbonic anhydrase